jgi:hypothetical protein
MATKFTPRLQLPYPADAAEGWYSAFADFATGVDTALLGVLEANAWAFSALPDATIESDGGTGYQLTLAGPFTAIGRTFGTPVTVLAGSTALTPTWLLGVTVPTGATAPSTATLTCVPSAATIDPAFRVLGYVNADSSATWWNAGTHAVGATQRLFAVGGGGGGGAWTATFTQAVSAGSTVTGVVSAGITEGILYSVVATVTAGASDGVDLELGDASFTGGPTVLYQIGYVGVEPRWNPTADGPWVDRNPAGIEGLTSGNLYWRLSNNAVTSVTVRVVLKGMIGVL